ncbi:MAG: lytic transglycosylase domain-containing protein [Deltaproteobacteria bacterium]|nr:lytic transglycosylase domain-containing protein [Deltaproteobacteria bacterium]
MCSGNRRQIVGFCFLIVLFLVSVSPRAFSDIYRYKDDNGVWHFTNVKNDKRYRLYIRTPREKPSAYIKKYEGIIKQASSRFGVASSLIKAVIKTESDFDHRAVSHKGAKGLMQLMPETAGAMDVKDPYDPEENIFGGTRYLSQLLVRFKDIKKALAAYNAGPDLVEKYHGVPPIPETRMFVQKVMNYYRRYNTKRP